MRTGNLQIGFSSISAFESGFSGFSGAGFSGPSGFSGQGASGFSGTGGPGVSGFSGISGFSGTFSGFSGTSGFSSLSGFSGFSSLSGFSGRSGFSGAGFSGPSGFSGAGASGFSGAKGDIGTSGFSGASGFSGTFSGFSGESGFSGAGFSGPSGFSGNNGPSGFSGFSGSGGGGGTTTTWASFTPTWTGETTNPVIGNGTLDGFWRRDGQDMLMRISLIPGSTTSFGSGRWGFVIPNGLTINTSVLGTSAGWNMPLGVANFIQTGIGQKINGVVVLKSGSTTEVVPRSGTGFTSSTVWSSTAPVTWVNGDKGFFEARIPIQEWS